MTKTMGVLHDVLFIGGPEDGETIIIDMSKSGNMHRHAVEVDVEDFSYLGLSESISKPSVTSSVYHLEEFALPNDVSVYVYRHETLTLRQALVTLLSGYEPKPAASTKPADFYNVKLGKPFTVTANDVKYDKEKYAAAVKLSRQLLTGEMPPDVNATDFDPKIGIPEIAGGPLFEGEEDEET